MVAALQFPGLANGSTKYVSPHLRIDITIWPQEHPQGFVNRDMKPKRLTYDPKETGASLIAFNWQKSMGQPSGTWAAMIKEPHPKSPKALANFQDFAVDGDWVDITVVRNGVRIPLCRGVVDSHVENTTAGRGHELRTWMTRGRDHGAFFEYPVTYTNLWVQTLGELTQGLFTERVKGKIGGRPDEMFKILIEATFNKGSQGGQWEVPPALAERLELPSRADAYASRPPAALWDLLRVVAFDASTNPPPGLRGAYYNEPQLWAVGKHTLHQTLHQWCNPLLNEMWYDLLPPAGLLPKHGLNNYLTAKPLEQGKLPTTVSEGAFTEAGVNVGRSSNASNPLAADKQSFGTMGAIIRERPFFNTINGRFDSMWISLPTWVLPRWLLQSTQLGRSGNERYNLFALNADIGFVQSIEQAAQAKPTWDKQSIRTHGLRTFEQSTKFIAQFRKGVGDWLGVERPTWQKLLIDWYAPSPYLRSGLLVVKTMLPEIRIGHRLLQRRQDDPKTDEQLYVEGVALNWKAPTKTSGATGDTTLTCTHGFQGDDSAYYKAVKEVSGLFEETF